jgi:hypothetical protein
MFAFSSVINVSLGLKGTLTSVGVTERPTTDTALRLSSTRTENLHLRSRVAALEQQDKQLRNRLRLYKNSNTPPSKEALERLLTIINRPVNTTRVRGVTTPPMMRISSTIQTTTRQRWRRF